MVHVISPGQIDADHEKPAAGRDDGRQELYVLKYDRPELNHGVAMPFVADTMWQMGGWISVKI